MRTSWGWPPFDRRNRLRTRNAEVSTPGMNPNFTSDTSSSLDEMSVPLRAVSEQGTHASAGDGNAVSLLTILIYQTIYREG